MIERASLETVCQGIVSRMQSDPDKWWKFHELTTDPASVLYVTDIRIIASALHLMVSENRLRRERNCVAGHEFELRAYWWEYHL